MMEIWLISLSVCLCLALVLIVWQSRKLRLLDAKLNVQQQAIQDYNGDLASLCAAAVVVDNKLSGLDERLNYLTQMPQNVPQSAPSSHLEETVADDEEDEADWLSQPAVPEVIRAEPNAYQNAIDQIRQGASVDELIKNCGLTRDEADLLWRVHGRNAR